MGFIKYLSRSGTGNRIQEGFVRIARHKKGAVILTLNKSDAVKHLGHRDYVEMFYDPSIRTIAIRPCFDGVDGAIKIGRAQSTTLHLTGFFSRFNISHTGTAQGSFWVNDDGMLIVNLETMAYDLAQKPSPPNITINHG